MKNAQGFLQGRQYRNQKKQLMPLKKNTLNLDQIKRIAIVGSGLMGHGIAQEFATFGYNVCLVSRRKSSLKKATEDIQKNLGSLITLGVITKEQAETVPSNISTTTVLEEAVEDVDVVIESVYEDLELKQKVFGELDRLSPKHTILASNSSSFIPSNLTPFVKQTHRVIGTHYINPPYLIPLVEVIRGSETSDETVKTISMLLRSVGKQPIVQRETPGFVAGRLQAALLREALWLVENDIAHPQDIDNVIKTSLGRRWAAAGIFEILEIAGWDLLLIIASSLFPHLGSSPKAPEILKKKVALGELGLKTGKGFYDWTPESAKELKQRITNALAIINQW